MTSKVVVVYREAGISGGRFEGCWGGWLGAGVQECACVLSFVLGQRARLSWISVMHLWCNRVCDDWLTGVWCEETCSQVANCFG